MKDLLKKGLLICLLVLVASVFVSCGGNKDETGGGSQPTPSVTPGTQEHAVYVYTRDDVALGVTFTTTMTAEFKTDGTWEVTQETVPDLVDKGVEVVMSGTYTGNAAVDGTITVTILKEMDDSGAFVDYTGDDATMDITITNGKAVFDDMEFTRQ